VPLLVTDAIVLHAFDYLESSRIVRMVTRDAGLRSALAKGARKSRRRFGSAMDLFAQGTAHLYTKPGRDLDTLAAFEDVTARSQLAHDLERFAGAEMIAEMVLRLGAAEGGEDTELFDAVASALDSIGRAEPCDARAAALAGAWRVIATLGVEPALTACAECDSPIPAGETVAFSYAAGGVLCARCAATAVAERKLPPEARETLIAWLSGRTAGTLGEPESRAHQRLLREFITYHLHDGRELRAFEMWEGGSMSATDDPRPTTSVPE
jgi:DNA repair protein RecO (recombination protein O)